MPSDFLTLKLNGRVPMKFRLIPPGEFRMGSRGMDPTDEVVHRVKITSPFYIGVYPVTQLQWRTIVETTSAPEPLNAAPSRFKDDDRPVERVSWHDAQRWCERLLQCSQVRNGKTVAGEIIEKIELPTEAQWEYACRLVQTSPSVLCSDTEYHTGDGHAALAAAGWYRANAGSETHDVGGKAPNGIGLYDMHGNVREWCRDAWDAHAYKARVSGVLDPSVGLADDRALRVFRGGSWIDSVGDCRAASRYRDIPGNRSAAQGFRVCLFFGPDVPSQQASSGAESEPAAGDEARRQAAAESQDGGGGVAELDLSKANLPERSDGTTF